MLKVYFFKDINENCKLLMASTSGDKTLRLWDASDFSILRVFESHDRYVTCCAFSPLINDEYIYMASGSNDRTICIWKISGSYLGKKPLNRNKMENWSTDQVNRWIFDTFGNEELFSEIKKAKINGAILTKFTQEILLERFPSLFDGCKIGLAHDIIQRIQWDRFKNNSSVPQFNNSDSNNFGRRRS